MKYRFIYRGEVTQPGTEQETSVKLSRLFRVSNSDAAKLFSGDYEFVRDNLSLSMADDYQALFLRVGARSKIEQVDQDLYDQSDNSQRANGISANDKETGEPNKNLTSGPKAREVQSNYGHHIQKQLDQSNALHVPPEIEPVKNSSKHAQSAHQPSTNKHLEYRIQKKSLAANWLRIGGLAVAGTLIADSQLQTSFLPDQEGIDIGIWPILFAHIPLFIGCYFLAKEKRLSPPFRFFGLLSFAGLSILMLLPAKGQKDHKVGFKGLALAVFSCSVFVYWLGGSIRSSADTSVIYAQLASLRDGRQEYPSPIRQGESHVYQNEQREMRDAILDVIALAKSETLRPDEVTDLTEAMLGELGHYIAWRRYQIFRHHSDNKKLPRSLREDEQDQDQAIFKSLLVTSRENPHPRFHEEVMFWTIGPYGTRFSRPRAETRNLDQLFDSLLYYEITNRESFASSKNNKKADQKPRLDLEKIGLPRVLNTAISRHKDYAVYEFVGGPMQGKTLAIGFFYTERKVKKSWESEARIDYKLNYAVINADLPATSMSPLVTVFWDYKPDQF